MKKKSWNIAKGLFCSSVLFMIVIIQIVGRKTSSNTQMVLPQISSDKTEVTCINENMDNFFQKKNFQFESASDLMTYYMDCIRLNRYEDFISISKNLSFSEDALNVWKSIICYGGAFEIKTEQKRALYGVVIPFEDSGISGIPSSSKRDISIFRYLYVRKDGRYWYADGPLHNDYPPEEWWSEEDFVWDVYDYGFSDRKEKGMVIYSQEQLDIHIEKCYQDFNIRRIRK